MKPHPIDIIGVLLAWLALLAVACGAEAHPSVCRIGVICPDGTRAYGSGTYVGDGYVLTCSHLFNDGASKIEAGWKSGWVLGLQVVVRDQTWDLAVLRCPYVPSITPVELAGTAPKPGDTLTAAGWGSDCTYREVQGMATQRLDTVSTNTGEMIEVRGALRPGDSGGPLFNEHGELAAVCWGTDGRIFAGAFGGRLQRMLSGAGWRKVRPYAGGSCPNGVCPRIQNPTRPSGGFHTEEAPARPPVCKPAKPDLDCVTQEQFAALVQRVTELEITVGKLVSVAPPVPEPTPNRMDELFAAHQALTVQIQASVEETRRLSARLTIVEGKAGKGDKGERGPPGPMGLPGAPGAPGTSAAINLDDLAEKVAAKLPPIRLVSRDKATGQVYWDSQAEDPSLGRPGDTIPLPGIEVHHVAQPAGNVTAVQQVHLADVLTIDETPISILVKPDALKAGAK